MITTSFWRGRRVLLTGHTGFKGAWLSLWLTELGAELHGLALPPDTDPALFAALSGRLPDRARRFGDVRDPDHVAAVVADARPEIVVHMAAQALVRRGYAEPAATFATNVMGTVNLLDALSTCPDLKAILIVTSDKVYAAAEPPRAHTETDALGGHDPYSASKAAQEWVATAYRASRFAARGVPLATARAGNVIGGGDWSKDRIVPDIWRSLRQGQPVSLRHPAATRPWQHVLEPLAGYLAYAERLARTPDGVPLALNFGPDPAEPVTVAGIVERFQSAYGSSVGWEKAPGEHPPEATHLAVDSELARSVLGWRPVLSASDAVRWTAEWYRAYGDDAASAADLCRAQLKDYGTRMA